MRNLSLNAWDVGLCDPLPTENRAKGANQWKPTHTTWKLPYFASRHFRDNSGHTTAKSRICVKRSSATRASHSTWQGVNDAKGRGNDRIPHFGHSTRNGVFHAFR